MKLKDLEGATIRSIHQHSDDVIMEVFLQSGQLVKIRLVSTDREEIKFYYQEEYEVTEKRYRYKELES